MTGTLKHTLANRPPDYALGRKGIKWFEGFENQWRSGEAFEELLAELEDQKYELAPDSSVFVVDYTDVLKAIGNFKEQILGEKRGEE